MTIERFIEALDDCDLNPTEIADILWLALRQPPPSLVSPQEDRRGEIVREEREVSDYSFDTSTALDEQESNAVEVSKDNPFDIALQGSPGIIPPTALPISVPDVGFLDETLPLVRALKPLLKRVMSTIMSRVDEVKTVEQIAEIDIWSPIMQPDREPWFEVALVIDDSAAMTLWQRLIDDIQRLLRCYGSFRALRIWKLVVDEEQVGVRTLSDSLVRSPKELVSPDARRLTIVFSDCTADYWWDGSLQPVLSLWGNAMPTVIWQVLPDWMWKRTALGVGESVAIRNQIPGATNQNLLPKFLSLHASLRKETSTTSVCLPVITTDADSIAAWSQVLAGDRRQVTPGFVLPSEGWERFAEHSSLQSEEQLQQFRLRATLPARRLAALLSAAPVITLPIMRLIRASMLSELSPLPVAEVFLSGLLQRSAEQSKITDPELVQYDFTPETRERLLDVLPPVEAIEVIEAVSQHVAERLNCTVADFRALLLSPDLEAEADQYGLLTFARITAQILRRLGADYAPLADQFEPRQAPEELESELIDLPLEDIEYEVAQFINFPPLQNCEYQSATITVILDRFDFETAELRVGESFPMFLSGGFNFGRRIQRLQSTAWGYTEILSTKTGEEAGIDMIVIPEGSFIMGAPTSELESRDDERPQHEVTLKSFYMGRYPITQAQWRVVAGYEQVGRELDPDPSRFKGDNCPVESVSWEDAQEFCKRLSRKTGKDYQLPSEAQWEYVCRAGTTTPFHFGEIIVTELANYDTTELANYDGSNIYNGSPEGEYRGQTTEVGSFPANNWGLHDMHGNVWEWCEDDYHNSYEGAPNDGSSWVETDRTETECILRGGSWAFNPRYCRSAARIKYSCNARYTSLAFRVCCVLPKVLPYR